MLLALAVSCMSRANRSATSELVIAAPPRGRQALRPGAPASVGLATDRAGRAINLGITPGCETRGPLDYVGDNATLAPDKVRGSMRQLVNNFAVPDTEHAGVNDTGASP